MRILIYNPYYKDVTRKVIAAVSHWQSCEVYDAPDHQSFQSAFGACLSGETIIVFFVDGDSDMIFLESMQSKFIDVKLLINHAGHDDKFYARILSLYPRMVTVTDKCALLLPEAVQGILKQIFTETDII